jgi:hypothetical protein
MLAGVQITFSYESPGDSPASGQLLPYKPTASEILTAPGTSSISASSWGNKQMLLSISAAAPIFYAVGPNPDPTGVAGPRRYMDPVFGREDVFCDTGDLFAWIYA